jgi:hypothetical protein
MRRTEIESLCLGVRRENRKNACGKVPGIRSSMLVFYQSNHRPRPCLPAAWGYFLALGINMEGEMKVTEAKCLLPEY